MESEQSELFEHEISLLNGMQGTAGNHDADMGLGAAVRHVAAMRLAKKNNMRSLGSQAGFCDDGEAGIATVACIWCVSVGKANRRIEQESKRRRDRMSKRPRDRDREAETQTETDRGAQQYVGQNFGIRWRTGVGATIGERSLARGERE